jgi:uncharacterized repeat protein (TIGR01451 family)
MKSKLVIAAALMIALLGAASAGAQANAANYSFSTTTTGSLTNMSSGTTQLLAANIDDTASPVTLLGFDFFFMGVRQDRFSINENGVLRFAAGAQAGSPYKPLAQAAVPIVTAYGADQRTHAGDGKVHFKVTGAAPNRVATVEWLNNQADFNAGGTAGLTYQVRLFETTGCIEYAYGSMTMSAAGAADANSQNPNIGFSSSNAAGTVGSVTAAQSGTPAPTYNGASATPVANLYTAGAIPVLTSAADGSRRTFSFCPAAPAPAGGPLSFTAVTQTGMTLNWTDSANEVGYAVYSSTDGGATYTFAGAAAQNATSFVASGLAPSTTYDWKVVATSEGALAAALTGTQATTAPTPKTSTGTGLWSAPGTWSPAGVPGSGDAVTIAAGHTVTIDTAASAFSVTVAGTGILQYEQTTARTLTVASNVNVQAGGTFRSNPAGTVTTHNLSLAGSLTNDGTLDFSTNADTAGAIITFTGTANTALAGSGATTDIRQITVNKGTTPAAIVELMPASFTVRGVTTDTVVGGWLVMSNGTLKISGTFAGTSRVFAAAAYTIPISFGFWLNNPNYVVAAQAGSAVNNGQFRVSQGTFNQGTLASHTFRSGVGAVFTIEGGTVNCAGQFSPQNAVTYNQSGGTLNVGTVGNSQSNFGTFELFSPSATFNMTGGTINVVQASTGATQIDYQNLAIVTAATGTLRIGTGATVTKFTFNVRGSLPNFIIDNTTNNKTATATAQVNLLGTTLINTGTTLTINGQVCLVVGPTFTNNGTLTGTAAGTRFYFLGGSGPTTYNGTGVVTAPLTAFEVDNVAGVTLDPAVNPVVALRINNFSGGVTNANRLTVGNGGATTAVVQLGVAGVTQPVNGFDVPPVFNPGTGGVNLLYAPELTGRTTGPEMPPSRTLNLLSITNPNNITIAGGDVTVNGAAAGALALGSARLITGPNTLYFNSAAGTVTRTTGYVDGNFRKSFAAAASKTFELGTANGYTPVVFNATAGTFPADVTVAAVQTPAPGIQPLTAVISRYWRLTATGITADVTFNYLDPADIPGTVTEANLHVLKHESGNPADFSDQGGTISTAANTATVTGVSSFSDWTLGEAGADLSITKTDGVTTALAGGSVTYTITASNGGTVGNPAAVVADTFPAGLTCSTTCAGSLGGTCAAGPIAGDINDTANLPSGGSVTYTAVCAISPSATGSLTNTATVSGGAVTDAVAANNSATDTDTLGLSADLAITKTDGVTTATAGGSVTYTITASNAGPSAATGATVADTFPASLTCTWTCVGAGGGTCTAAGSGNINGSVNLPAGGSVTYTASCAVSAAATGTLSNTATVTAPAGVSDPTPGNNSATDSDTLAANADLSITKTDGVTTATAGGSVTYTITASNAGPSNATGATVADTFPASLTCTWTCAGAGGGTCTASGSGNINGTVNLPSGGSVTYTASCTVSAAATGTLSNTATVTAPAGVADPTPGNNSATDSDTLGASADLAITKTDGVTTATPGGSVTYTIVASNAGPSTATGTTVADTFPASLTCTWTCVGAGGGTCTAAGSGNINGSVNLPSGGSVTYTASCTISGAATGTLSNTATVTAPAGVADPTPGNNSATDSDALGASADLAITKTDGVLGATPGGSLTYTIVASNAGPSTATGATVTDTFPASLTCTWTCTGAGGGTCTAAGSGNIGDTVSLPSGGSVTYTASCAVSVAATNSVMNTATVAAPAGVTDPNPGNNTATDDDIVSSISDLSITKTDGVTSVTAGGPVTYTIVASNAGPSNAAGTTVTDTFPASLTCTWTCAGAGGGTCTAAGSGNIGDTVNLPAGGSVSYTASCTLSAAATGTLANTATVSVSNDPTPGNNSATDTDTVNAAPGANVTGTKTASGTFTAGSTVTYTIILTNSGSGAQADNPGNELIDVLPAQLTLVSATATSGAAVATVGTNTVTWNGAIPAAGTVTVTITATINAGATGTISNQGTISYDTDGNGTNDGTAQTDDPASAGAANPTTFVVGGGQPVPPIPTLSDFGLLALAAALAMMALAVMRRRRTGQAG